MNYSYLQLTKTETTYWLVIEFTKLTYSKHACLELAEREAKRLAIKRPELSFVVFKVCSAYKLPTGRVNKTIYEYDCNRIKNDSNLL